MRSAFALSLLLAGACSRETAAPPANEAAPANDAAPGAALNPPTPGEPRGLPDDRTPNRADWSRLSARWRAELDARIEQLSRLRDTLDDCIGCGCLSLTRCRLANPADVLGHQGEGARRWSNAGAPGR